MTVMILILARATAWAGDGFWAPDGLYSRFITPIVFLAWVAVVSGFLYMRSPSAVTTPARAAVPAA